MTTFQIELVPCTMSPVIRDMHRRTIKFEAASLNDARALVKRAFPDGADLTGEWFVTPKSLMVCP